jgi:Domain of unknown function (DUF4136)
MKFGKVFAILWSAVALATAAFAQHVAVDYDRAANFKQIKTYSWAKLHTADPITDNRVKEAIDQELAAKGWSQLPSLLNSSDVRFARGRGNQVLRGQ